MRRISVVFMIVFAVFSVFGGNFVLKVDKKSVATGITICFKNKKFLERKYNLSAVSDFTAHLLKVKYAKFEDDFKLIGAEVQFYDYPFIPFDDYYTNDYFGFIRIKVLPENTEKALFLARKLIDETLNFNDRDFKIAVKSTFGSNMMRNRKKLSAKSEIWKNYFGNSFVVLPDYCFNPSFQKDEVRQFLKEYISNSNTFVSVYGNFNSKSIGEFLKKNFSAKNYTTLKKSLPVVSLKNHKVILDKKSKQAYVYLVYPVKDGISFDDFVRLSILTANASDKIAFEIREKEGLAYSIGCYLEYKGGHLFFIAYCGTNPDKADYVAGKIKKLADNLMFSPVEFDDYEIQSLKNRLILSNTLKTLPNVNKSFFNALYTFTGFCGFDKIALDKGIKKEKIKRLCGKDYLDSKNYLYIIQK